MYQPLSIKTGLKKGPFSEYLNTILKEDSYECSFSTFLETVYRSIPISKWLIVVDIDSKMDIASFIVNFKCFWFSLKTPETAHEVVFALLRNSVVEILLCFICPHVFFFGRLVQLALLFGNIFEAWRFLHSYINTKTICPSGIYSNLGLVTFSFFCGLGMSSLSSI